MKENKPPNNLFLNRKVYIASIIAVAVLFALFFSLMSDSVKAYLGLRQKQEPEVVTEISLTFAFQNPQWNAQIEQTVADFEQAYPQIRVTYEPDYEHVVYEDVLARRIARNELGDIVQLKTPAAYVDGNYLAPIPDEVSKDISYVYQDDGKTWAVGAVETTNGILYNKKIFEQYQLKEPATYDEFLNICSVLKENGIVPIGVAGEDLWHMEYWVNHYFRTDALSKNGDWLNDAAAGLVSWTDPEVVQMLDDMKGLFENQYVNEDWRAVSDGTLPYMLANGNVAMVFTGPWTAAGMQETDVFEAGWFLVPDREGRTFAAKNQDTFWALSKECAKDEEVYQAAVCFLEFFYSQDNYSRICENTLTFPVKEIESVTGPQDGIRADIMESNQNSTKKVIDYIGNSSCPQNFEADMLEIIEAYLGSDESAEEAAEKIQTAWLTRMETEKANE
ncbi:MAG: extracellular solute-binding protein [Lachnospiraceae bacterium]|nr:extracellular solute-binding protein [Lachnospiraceae bacterium]